jgi:hypothetical protein
MRNLLAVAIGLALLTGCLPFKDDGLYACDPDTGKDCVTCDAATGWCRDITANAAGATALYGISGIASNAIWAVGDKGVIIRWNGTRWIPQTSGTGVTLNAVWASAVDDVMAVGYAGRASHYNGANWSTSIDPTMAVPGSELSFTAVGGNRLKGLLWSADNAANVSFWKPFAPTDRSGGWTYYGSAVTADSIWGVFTDNDATSYFVGNQGKIYRDLASYTDFSQALDFNSSGKTESLYAVWGDRGTKQFWAVGHAGTILHWNTTTFVDESVSAIALWGICGSSEGIVDLWVVGSQGYVAHNTGAGWIPQTPPTDETLFGVYCTPTDVFAVTEKGAILHKKR